MELKFQRNSDSQTQVHGLLSRATAARPCLKVWAVTVLCPLPGGEGEDVHVVPVAQRPRFKHLLFKLACL